MGGTASTLSQYYRHSRRICGCSLTSTLTTGPISWPVVRNPPKGGGPFSTGRIQQPIHTLVGFLDKPYPAPEVLIGLDISPCVGGFSYVHRPMFFLHGNHRKLTPWPRMARHLVGFRDPFWLWIYTFSADLRRPLCFVVFVGIRLSVATSQSTYGRDPDPKVYPFVWLKSKLQR